ncbi:MAG: cytochrome C [Geobacteraceae bacterium GWC2_58_44]|nr:MAG: cytochrome C [Geobacteraceae bacterium GWC2_58_44]HBG06623.1 cytochrome C [Geobacter sp.]
MQMRLRLLLGVMCIAVALWGCDPLTRHKVTSTIFDGVPSLPPADQYCQDYHERALLEEKQLASKKKTTAEIVESGSSHPPYKEKRCDKCHDKSKESGLIKPRDELCFVCHPKIIDNYYIHGPASVGSCLECHEPHSSGQKSLLKAERGKLCIVCHKEARIATSMHDKVTSSGLFCMDCHNPHAGAVKYFLR